MGLLDDCDLLFMVLMMRCGSGESVCRNTLQLADFLVSHRILVISGMLRKTLGVLLMEVIALRSAR